MIADRGSRIADRRLQTATRSAIVCDHMETTSVDPAIVIAEDRTMFYLKAGFHMIADRRSQTIAIDRRRSQMVLSSAIVCDHDRRIADDRRSSFHMIADDRRPYCDLRSAIRDHMETSL